MRSYLPVALSADVPKPVRHLIVDRFSTGSGDAGRQKAQFIDELMKQDCSRAQAEKEVNTSIDRLIYYSGWCDKFL